MIKKLIKDIIKGEGGFNKGEGISPKSEGIPQKGESISNSPPSGKEGWLKAGVVGGYTMLIITDLWNTMAITLAFCSSVKVSSLPTILPSARR